jgi:hypothetical protein
LAKSFAGQADSLPHECFVVGHAGLVGVRRS